jgi:PAS domain S-box-containing protein
MAEEKTLEEKYNDLKLENEELHAEIDYMNMLFDQYVITSVTDTKGYILSASKPFEDISGYTQEELIGSPHNIVRHEDMPKEAFEDLWKTIQNKEIWRGEVKNRKKDGGYYWVDSTIIPLLNSDHEIIGYRAIRIDITDQKKAHDSFSDILLDTTEHDFLDHL